MTDAPGDRRPRDLALLLLAARRGPPRQRARDQQADLSGEALRAEILSEIVARDPDQGEFEEVLLKIIEGARGPTGPPRAIAALILEEWQQARSEPGYWNWLLNQAIEAGYREASPS